MIDRHSRDAVSSRLRLRSHDYASAATYFVTVCANERACRFSDIMDGAMSPSRAGVMVDSWWHSISWRYPDAILDAMVLMPNHLHAIISLGTNPEAIATPTLSAVIHWFKSRTTRDYALGVRTEGWPPYPKRLWQQGYYDHIIRSEAALTRIRAYIEANPSRWAEDQDNPRNALDRWSPGLRSFRGWGYEGRRKTAMVSVS